MINRDFGISEKIWNLLLEVISVVNEVEKAAIFGSRAIGSYSKGSDIDIAIYGDNADEKVALDICGILNERIPSPYFFDVVSMSNLKNSNLREHIERVGKTIYSRYDKENT